MDCEMLEAKLGNGQSTYYCARCQRPFGDASGKKFSRNCKTPESPEQRELRLGDLAEKMLNSVGVTQERYVQAKAWLMGLPASEICTGCQKRKEFLNTLGQRFLAYLSPKDSKNTR